MAHLKKSEKSKTSSTSDQISLKNLVQQEGKEPEARCGHTLTTVLSKFHVLIRGVNMTNIEKCAKNMETLYDFQCPSKYSVYANFKG